MTESNDGDSTSEWGGRLDVPAAKPFLRRAAISAIVGTVLIAIIQFFAPTFDYQIAFLVCLVIGAVFLGLTLFFLQRSACRAGHAWIVPLTTVAVAIVLIGLVRVRTLSGEMIPQFEWRLTSRRVPDLQTTVATPKADSRADSETDSKAGAARDLETPVEFDQLGSADAKLFSAAQSAPWNQFLGSQRDGIAAQREFAIPTASDEVKTLWDIGIGAGWSSFAVADNIAVTLEQRGELECVSAYRMTDGELLWIVDHDAIHNHPLGEAGPRSTPTISQGRVYAQGATGMLWCLDLKTGEAIWQVDLLDLAGWDQAASEVAITWGRSGSPLLVDGLCIVPLGGDDRVTARSLVALDAVSGEVRWQAGKDQISYASPQLLTLAGQRQIVIVNESTITGHAVETGTQLWQTDWPGQSNGGANCASVIPAGDNRILVGKGYGGGSALIEIKRGAAGDDFVAEDVWRSNRIMQTKFNHAVVRDGVAYGLSNGALQAINQETGEKLWEQSRRSRSGQGQVILAGDVLIVQEEMGDVIFVAADPNEYREWARLEGLEHKTWNVPSLVGNVLLIRNSVEAMALQLPEIQLSHP